LESLPFSRFVVVDCWTFILREYRQVRGPSLLLTELGGSLADYGALDDVVAMPNSDAEQAPCSLKEFKAS
jgi:hypothetical protein